MTNLRKRAGFHGLVLAAVCGLAPVTALVVAPETAQAQPPAAERPTPAQLLNDFMHYVLVDRYDLAEAMGRELLDRNVPGPELVAMIETGDVARFTSSCQRAMRDQRLEEVSSGLLKAYESGKLARARDPIEILKNIEMLGGTVRGRLMARERLLAAGEYAMPQLLTALLDRSNTALGGEVRRVIIDLGRQAVIPMATAMMKLPETQQETVAETLGLIPWKTSLPFLVDLSQGTKNAKVRDACLRSIERVGGGAGEAGALYRELATAYYDERLEVTSFTGEDHQLLWSYEPAIGLVMTAIRTSVYHEAMAMRLAERAMQLESASGMTSDATLALWVAANFSREIDAPAGYENPAYAADRRGADYFAAAAGPRVCQLVLTRALTDRDTPLARRALAMVERTAGSRALASAEGRTALVDALNYPNRRVQFEAALALGVAQPRDNFAGADRVVPTLAGAVRGASSQVAMVIGADAEAYQSTRKMLQGLGYTVLPLGRNIGELSAAIAEAPAIDLIVGNGLDAEKAPAMIGEARGTPKLSATPVLLLAPSDQAADMKRRYLGDARVAVRPVAAGEAMLAQAAKDLVQAASGGPITEAEAASYSSRALSAMRDLAISGNTVLNVGDASAALTTALGETSGPTRMKVGEILSRIGQERCQRALMDAAAAASGAERVDLLNLTRESAKAHGNLLEARHITRLVDMASKGSDDEATAAASLLGSLEVAGSQVVPLILQSR